MNVINATQSYIQRMIESVRGMKVLLLDHETMGIVSTVFSQNEILQQEVYLFDLLDTSNRESMTHLKAICFLRPTPENLYLLIDELKKPKYEQYHLFFTNIIESSFLEELAHSDEHEVVHQVQEYYADYFPINPDVFSLNIESCNSLSANALENTVDRICDGLASVLLSLKRRPVIRYEKSSSLATKTAKELSEKVKKKELRTLFDFGIQKSGAPVLLILDRKSDPVTPLLAQWTYQAMVHELLGIRNNRVTMPTANKEGEIVLSALQDEFYKNNVYSNFGDLGVNVKEKVNELQEHSKGNQNIQSIEDMKNFLQKFPEYQKLSNNVSKHVSILSELSNIASVRKLYDVSELEQEIATNNDHNDTVKGLASIIANPQIREVEKLKLLLLYSLRYEKYSGNQLGKLLTIYQRAGLDKQDAQSLLRTLQIYGGDDVRSGDLFGNKSWLAKAKTSLKRGMKEATNVYTQHNPLLIDQLQDLNKLKLSEVLYPSIDGQIPRGKTSDIIVFFVGGITYEEAAAIRDLKATPEFSNVRIVLGGTTIHNSQSFLRELRKLQDSLNN